MTLKEYPWDEVLFQSDYWLDRNHVRHPIEGMETSYIRNALRYAKWGCESLALAAWDYADKAPDAAGMEAERAATGYMDYDVPLVKALEAELERRKP